MTDAQEETRIPRALVGRGVGVEGRHRRRRLLGVMTWLPWSLLTARVASHAEASTTERPSAGTHESERPTLDRLLTRGDIQVAGEHLQAFGFDPDHVDNI